MRTHRRTLFVLFLLAITLGMLNWAVMARATPAPSSSSFQPYNTTCVWHMPADTPLGKYGWPQTFVGCGDTPVPSTCDEKYQRDHYVIESQDEADKLTQLEASGLSYAGQDSSLLDHGGSWDSPIDNEACPSDTPTPTPSTTPPSNKPPVSVITSHPSTHKPSQPTKSTGHLGPATSTHRVLTSTSAVPAAHKTPLATTGVRTWMMLALSATVIIFGLILVYAFKPRRNH
jgi:hypothetical protein